ASVFSCVHRTAMLRTVVDDDDFLILIIQFTQAFKTIANRPRSVVTANHDRDERPFDVVCKRKLRECLAHGKECWLRLAFAGYQAEVPIFDIESTAMPFVGPGEREVAGAPIREHG